MKKHLLGKTLIALAAVVIINACTKDDDNNNTLIDDNTIASDTTNTNNNDTTTTSSGVKPSATTFKFEANGKDCGITDGWADQQHLLPEKVHLNTDKCNGETYRPSITLDFGEAPVAGTYTVVTSVPAAKELTIYATEYNFGRWTGTAGSVIVTENETNSDKIDIQLVSITMDNDNDSTDVINPATDILTGYIIEI